MKVRRQQCGEDVRTTYNIHAWSKKWYKFLFRWGIVERNRNFLKPLSNLVIWHVFATTPLRE
jgi:hypothetical protein